MIIADLSSLMKMEIWLMSFMKNTLPRVEGAERENGDV